MRYVRTAVLLGLMALSTSAQAAIYAAHDSSQGGGLQNVTVDSETGLAWLDLTVSQINPSTSSFRSYNDVVAQLGTGGDFEGYRFATREEVRTFWQHAGVIADQDPPIEQSPAMSHLQDLWGRTSPPVNGFQRSLAVTGDVFSSSPAQHWSVSLSESATLPDYAITNSQFGGLDDDGRGWGFALVRSSADVVPEPATLTIWTLGVLGCAAAAYRRRRKVA